MARGIVNHQGRLGALSPNECICPQTRFLSSCKNRSAILRPQIECGVISQDEALGKILGRVGVLPSQPVALAEALDRYAAEELRGRLALPPFDNSAMDGYAVVAASCKKGGRLRVVGEHAAGVDRRLRVAPGEAVRIFTGAPLPEGADAVVMQEEVEVAGAEVVLQTEVALGEFVRRRGGDVAEGQRLLEIGDRITPQRIALLAAQGIGALSTGGTPRVAIISTGDELAAPGTALGAGQIYDSNAPLLRALVRRSGAKVEMVTHCRDRAEEIEEAVRAGASCDAMIITGGVSVGARDFVKGAITAAGGTLDLWRVRVKPGKPFLFGRANSCVIFGLPGNPVSAFVTFLLFVRPALLKMQGANAAELALPTSLARLGSSVSNDGDRPHYLRGSVRDGVFRTSGRQESHAVFGLSRSDSLLLVPPGETLAAESLVTVLRWS